MYILNLVLSAFFIVFQLFFYVVLPIIPLPEPIGILLAIFIIFTTTTYWSLVHDCTHGSFHQNKFINNSMGRIMSILFFSPFYILRLGHLLHHKFNRSLVDTTESSTSGSWGEKLSYYFRLMGGLYFLELAANFLVFLPQKQINKFAKKMGKGKVEYENAILANVTSKLLDHNLWKTRFDAVVILTLLSTTFILYGDKWYIPFIMLLGRAFIVSVSDNSYHYATKLNLARSGRNLFLNPSLQLFILNFNLHRIHHLYPNAPWFKLPKLFQEAQDQYDIGYFKSAVMQFQGPVSLTKLKTLE